MEKYLPIGSVCTLKGKNKKIMVTGFYAVEFNGNLKIDDYSGCAFPEGLLLPEFNCTFNHDDIESIDFVGFENDDSKKLNKLLNNLNSSNSEETELDDSNDRWILTSNKSYSKLLFDENGVVVIAEPTPEKEEKSIIKFDENGFVVAVEDEIDNPFYKNYETIDYTKKDNIENNIFDNEISNSESNNSLEQFNSLSKIKFDENGTVIAIDSEDLKVEEKYSKYKFDENGILVSVEEEETLEEEIPPIGPGLPGYVEPENKKVSNYSFDDDGNLIAEETYEFDANGNLVAQNKLELETEEEVPPIGPGLPGYVEPKKEPKYKFDEDGNVISE